MDVRWISSSGIEECGWSDVSTLLERDDGFVWVDVASCDEETAGILADRFGFHHVQCLLVAEAWFGQRSPSLEGQSTDELLAAGLLTKYGDRMRASDLTPASFAATYSQVVRVVPTRWLPWHGRAARPAWRDTVAMTAAG